GAEWRGGSGDAKMWRVNSMRTGWSSSRSSWQSQPKTRGRLALDTCHDPHRKDLPIPRIQTTASGISDQRHVSAFAGASNRPSSMQLCRRVDGIGKPAVREQSSGVLTHPADADGLDCLLPDGACAGHPELPVGDVEHVIGCRVPLRLDGEDKDIGADPGIYAPFVASVIKLPGRKAAEHKLRM